MAQPRAAGIAARRRARALLVQALYQHQLAGHDRAELDAQFRQRRGYSRADQAYFHDALAVIIAERAALDALIGRHADRGEEQLDPVARAILWLGLYELKHRADVPVKVAINEAVELAKRFGPTDCHRFVNAVLDRLSQELRAGDRSAAL